MPEVTERDLAMLDSYIKSIEQRANGVAQAYGGESEFSLVRHLTELETATTHAKALALKVHWLNPQEA
jgi:hypothetical protein